MTRLEKDALHIYAAVTIQIGAALAMRTTLASWRPWLVVAALLAINEYLDMFHGETEQVESWLVAGAIHDAWNTMLLPTLLMLAARYVPGLFRPPASKSSED